MTFDEFATKHGIEETIVSYRENDSLAVYRFPVINSLIIQACDNYSFPVTISITWKEAELLMNAAKAVYEAGKKEQEALDGSYTSGPSAEGRV